MPLVSDWVTCAWEYADLSLGLPRICTSSLGGIANLNAFILYIMHAVYHRTNSVSRIQMSLHDHWCQLPVAWLLLSPNSAVVSKKLALQTARTESVHTTRRKISCTNHEIMMWLEYYIIICQAAVSYTKQLTKHSAVAIEEDITGRFGNTEPPLFHGE